MDGVIEDFLTGERGGVTNEKENKKAILMCRDIRLVGVWEDGMVLVGEALRIMKFKGKYGPWSEEGSGLVDGDDSEIFMEIQKRDGTPVGVDEAVRFRGGGFMH